MSLRWRDAGAVSRFAGTVSFRTANGVAPGDLASVDQIRLRLVAGTDPLDLTEVYKRGIRLAATPASAYGASGAHSGPIYSDTVTVGVADGTPPYSHSWTATAGISVASPAASSTPFIGHPSAGDSVSGIATDTVTDANGLTNSIDVPVTIERLSYA